MPLIFQNYLLWLEVTPPTPRIGFPTNGKYPLIS